MLKLVMVHMRSTALASISCVLSLCAGVCAEPHYELSKIAEGEAWVSLP